MASSFAPTWGSSNSASVCLTASSQHAGRSCRLAHRVAARPDQPTRGSTPFFQPDSAAIASLRHLSSSEAQQASPEVPPEIAHALLASNSNDLQLASERYDPAAFDRSPYHGVYAVEVDGGLLVCLQTA
jgi:hypothetical protein